jgi:hypothetical protein
MQDDVYKDRKTAAGSIFQAAVFFQELYFALMYLRFNYGFFV